MDYNKKMLIFHYKAGKIFMTTHFYFFIFRVLAVYVYVLICCHGVFRIYMEMIVTPYSLFPKDYLSNSKKNGFEDLFYLKLLVIVTSLHMC